MKICLLPAGIVAMGMWTECGTVRLCALDPNCDIYKVQKYKNGTSIGISDTSKYQL